MQVAQRAKTQQQATRTTNEWHKGPIRRQRLIQVDRMLSSWTVAHMRKLPSDVAGALAAAMVRSGDAELGITLLQDVLTDDPSNQDLRLKLADSLVMAGRASEAHPHYRALLSDEQNKPGGGK